MHAHLICLAATLLGVDVGWQPWPGGGVEYLIQIPPHAVKTLESGKPLASEIPPNVPIRAVRITIGTLSLPQNLPSASDVGTRASATFGTGKAASDPFLPPPSTPVIEPAPRALAPDPASKPLGERQAAYLQPTVPKAKPEPKPAPEPPPAAAPSTEASRPWMPLTLSLLALFASLGGNVYLGWITWDTRGRYREFLGRQER